MNHKGFAGIWKLNLEASEIPPVTKSQLVTIDSDGDFLNIIEEIINYKGEYLKISFEGKLDGKDYPVNNTPFADTGSYRLLNPYVIEGIIKKNGKICVKETAVLSDSGDTLEVTYMFFDEECNSHKSFGVFERVN